MTAFAIVTEKPKVVTASHMLSPQQLPLLAEVGKLKISPTIFVCFELEGAPQGKGRPRFTIIRPRSKPMFVSTYTPKETVDYENALATVARIAMRGRAPTHQPVALLVHAFMPTFNSWPDRKASDALLGAILPTSKPDWDNIGKMTDALKGIVWGDDSAVVDGRVIKRYSENPALRIEVREFLPC